MCPQKHFACGAATRLHTFTNNDMAYQLGTSGEIYDEQCPDNSRAQGIFHISITEDSEVASQKCATSVHFFKD